MHGRYFNINRPKFHSGKIPFRMQATSIQKSTISPSHVDVHAHWRFTPRRMLQRSALKQLYHGFKIGIAIKSRYDMRHGVI